MGGVDAIAIIATCLILEAGGEGDSGMAAVAWVIHNRGGDPLAVVLKPKQFSCFNGGGLEEKIARARKHPRWGVAEKLARQVMWGGLTNDPTGGATHYHARSVMPYWAKSMAKTVEIGRHIFYKEKR